MKAKLVVTGKTQTGKTLLLEKLIHPSLSSVSKIANFYYKQRVRPVIKVKNFKKRFTDINKLDFKLILKTSVVNSK